MNVYGNLHYSFLFISFLVIPLFKKRNDFDLFLVFLVFFFLQFLSQKEQYTLRCLNQNLNRVLKDQRIGNSESSQRFLALHYVFVT